MIVASALVVLLASCGACDQPASPVTFRVVNGLDWPIFLRDEAGQLGVRVQRHVEGHWVDLVEESSCLCEECSEACSYCVCSQVEPMARRLDPNAAAERPWDGEYRVEQTVDCFGDTVECLSGRAPAQPGTYRLELCWAADVVAAATEEERFPAEFPASLSCTHRQFELPADAPVEIVTSPPPGCVSRDDCPLGQMCLGGRCSSTCLPHELPELGGDWNVEIGSPDDAGFFQVEGLGGDRVVYRGVGKVTSVRYAAGTTNMTLERWANGLDYRASFYFTLPGERTFPFTVGEELEVTLVDHPQGERRLARGLVIRRNGMLLLAADNGLGGRVLQEPGMSAPFVVETAPEPVACNPSDCGQRTHFRTVFSTAGGEPVALEPGTRAEVEVGGERYEVIAVANYSEEVQGCGRSPVSPYLVLVQEETSR